MHSPSVVRRPRTLLPLAAIALLASFASASCSAGPPGRRPPVLVDGPAQPGPDPGGGVASGASGDSNAADAGPDDGPFEPASACTALAECCSRFNMQDPAQGWCQESLVNAAGPDDCVTLLAYWGC